MTSVSRDDLAVFSLRSMPRPQFAADMFALIVILTGVYKNESIVPKTTLVMNFSTFDLYSLHIGSLVDGINLNELFLVLDSEPLSVLIL